MNAKRHFAALMAAAGLAIAGGMAWAQPAPGSAAVQPVPAVQPQGRISLQQAIAAAEIHEEFEGDSLVRQFEALEYKGGADQALLELKRKMGVLPPASSEGTKKLGKGDDVQDAELLE